MKKLLLLYPSDICTREALTCRGPPCRWPRERSNHPTPQALGRCQRAPQRRLLVAPLPPPSVLSRLGDSAHATPSRRTQAKPKPSRFKTNEKQTGLKPNQKPPPPGPSFHPPSLPTPARIPIRHREPPDSLQRLQIRRLRRGFSP
jgi:hypothetical protein